ncbi:MAG: penicillin-binding protein activator LpoB, partial [Magnetococcales bacterium]|nr:penicillin-binding protein activator LpoB [Magnetococcales bacterium]
MTRIVFLAASFWLLLGIAPALAALKIAVTDLSYEEKVQEYFRSVSVDYRHARKGGRRGETELQYDEQEGTRVFIERGELHKFTADIKGELLRAGYQVVQGRPFAMKAQEKLFDIIARIKQGYYKGAHYVLFGTISSLEFREESSPIAGTARTFSESLSLELVVEFSLINTKTYEVVAAFSAMGEGSDVRLRESAAARVHLSRGKAIAEAAKSIAQESVRQMHGQLTGASPQEMPV